MNPLSSVSVPSQLEGLQRIEGSRPQDPPAGTERSREQQAERALQPRSGVRVSISEAARERASAELDPSRTVNGGNGASATGSDPRDATPQVGSRLDVRA
ncbi:MAG: hypothetical protein KatS3mg126_1241 [Lysobacteraceae bacterium]|nr:MAG: hypothetical protein KatS3mg126_1241 [Xanthomonadaceae bacterium]